MTRQPVKRGARSAYISVVRPMQFETGTTSYGRPSVRMCSLSAGGNICHDIAYGGRSGETVVGAWVDRPEVILGQADRHRGRATRYVVWSLTWD
jgi:hypothetical protein